MTHQMIKYLDKTGRLTIPVEIRQEFHWDTTVPLLIDISENTLSIKDLKKACIFCNKIAIHHYKNQPICEACYQDIKNGSK